MARFFSLTTGLTGLATIVSTALPKTRDITEKELLGIIKRRFPFLTLTKTPVLESYQKRPDGTFALRLQVAGNATLHCIAGTPQEAILLARRKWIQPREGFVPVYLETAKILPVNKKDKEKEALYRKMEAQYYLERKRRQRQKAKEETERKRRQKEIAKFQDKTHPKELTPKAFQKLVDVLFTLAESKQGARALKVAGLTLGILALDAQLRAMHMAFAASPNGAMAQDPTQNGLLRHLLGQRNIRRLLGYSPRLLQRNSNDQIYAPRDVVAYIQDNPNALDRLARANGDRQIEQGMLLDRSPEGRAYLDGLTQRTGIQEPSFVDLLQQPTVTDYVQKTYDSRLEDRLESQTTARMYPDTVVPLEAVLLPGATRTLAEDALYPEPDQIPEQTAFRKELRAAILHPSPEPPLARVMERFHPQEESVEIEPEQEIPSPHFLDGIVAKDVARDAIESMRVLQQEENAPDEERQEGRLIEANRAIALLHENNNRIAPLAYINRDLVNEQARILDESQQGRDYLRQLRRKTGIENPTFAEILKAPSVSAYVAGVYDEDLARRNEETMERQEGRDALQELQKATGQPITYNDLLDKGAILTLAEDALHPSAKTSMEEADFYKDMRDLIEQPKSGHEELEGVHAPLMEAMGRMNVRGVFPETQQSVFSSLGIENLAKGIVDAAQKLGDTLTNQTYREIHTVKTRTTTTITRTSWDE